VVAWHGNVVPYKVGHFIHSVSCLNAY
jgi:homogentisate 1,2-dioxygenase